MGKIMTLVVAFRLNHELWVFGDSTFPKGLQKQLIYTWIVELEGFDKPQNIKIKTTTKRHFTKTTTSHVSHVNIETDHLKHLI